jgi:hypothetical protein
MNDTTSDQKQKFEVWKHYAATGGADKDWMIQIVTWLLAFSAGIIGFYATGELRKEAFVLILLGILISFVAAATSLLYGAYAAWNWAIADQIAKKYKWKEQEPDYNPFEGSKVSWVVRLAKPCQNRIAPIFWLFFGASLVSLAVHVFLLSRV